MTPLEVEILLHCHSKGTVAIPNIESEAVLEAVSWFHRNGYIVGGFRSTPAGAFSLTERGCSVVERLCAVPLEDPAERSSTPRGATDFLDAAASEMRDRAAARDTPEGERSVARTVDAFWSLYGDAILARGHMSEHEGWQFLSLLKKRRGAQGEYRADDYTDDVAYTALAAEAAARGER